MSGSKFMLEELKARKKSLSVYSQLWKISRNYSRKKTSFKGNTSGSSESETWIEKIHYSSIYASQSVELDRLIINVLDLPFFGDFFSVKGIMDTMALVFKLTNYFPLLK